MKRKERKKNSPVLPVRLILHSGRFLFSNFPVVVYQLSRNWLQKIVENQNSMGDWLYLKGFPTYRTFFFFFYNLAPSPRICRKWFKQAQIYFKRGCVFQCISVFSQKSSPTKCAIFPVFIVLYSIVYIQFWLFKIKYVLTFCAKLNKITVQYPSWIFFFFFRVIFEYFESINPPPPEVFFHPPKGGGCCTPSLDFLYRMPDNLLPVCRYGPPLSIDTKMSTIELHMTSLWHHKVSAPSEIWIHWKYTWTLAKINFSPKNHRNMGF